MRDEIKKLLEYEFNNEKPFYITSPSGSSGSNLRVYAYGGDVGTIDAGSGSFCISDMSSKNEKNMYAKHLKSTTTYKRSGGPGKPPVIETRDNDRRPLEGKFPINDDLQEELENHIWETDINKLFSEDNKKYIDLLLTAMMNWSRNKVESIDKFNTKERRVQMRFAKKNVYNVKYSAEKMIVTDVEFELEAPFTGKIHSINEKKLNASIKKNKDFSELAEEEFEQKKIAYLEDTNGEKLKVFKVKPDMIMFDGEKFGLVELKAHGESMTSTSDNSLKKHCLDFCDLIADGNDKSRSIEGEWKEYTSFVPEDVDEVIRKAQWDAFRTCVNRARVLLDNGLIDQSWRKSILEAEEYCRDNKQDNVCTRFWCGFLFIDGDKKRIDKNYVKRQLKDFKGSDVDIRYQFIQSEEPSEINMVEKINNYL